MQVTLLNFAITPEGLQAMVTVRERLVEKYNVQLIGVQ